MSATFGFSRGAWLLPLATTGCEIQRDLTDTGDAAVDHNPSRDAAGVGGSDPRGAGGSSYQAGATASVAGHSGGAGGGVPVGGNAGGSGRGTAGASGLSSGAGGAGTSGANAGFGGSAGSAANPGPQVPPPAGLWQAPPGAIPAMGNYVYLNSDAGDFIGGGATYLYDPTNAALSVNSTGAHVGLTVAGDIVWHGDFQGMTGLSQLVAGYYGDLTRYPFQDNTKGGLSWDGGSRGCNMLRGWLVIDDVVYAGSTLTEISLRFEQHCEGSTPALHGQLRWNVNDNTAPPGPVTPVPDNLWRPAANATPTSGNYVYLKSDAGDYIGGGQTYTYTQANCGAEG